MLGADNEIPSEEFLKAAKKKRRVFNEQINKLVDKVIFDLKIFPANDARAFECGGVNTRSGGSQTACIV